MIFLLLQLRLFVHTHQINLVYYQKDISHREFELWPE